MQNLVDLKRALYNQCVAYAELRIHTAQAAIQLAQSSANDETKSSAGDKYETGRSMMQLEVERNTAQLAESLKLKQVLDQINPDKESTTVLPGSLVVTNQGNFYVAISVGQLTFMDHEYFVIAPHSPIGMKFMHASSGSSFIFHGKVYTIEQVI